MVYPVAFQDNLSCCSTPLFETIKDLPFLMKKKNKKTQKNPKQAAPSHRNSQGLQMEFWFWKTYPLTQAWEKYLRGEKKNWNAKFALLANDIRPFLFSNIRLVSWWNFCNWKPATHLTRTLFHPSSELICVSGFSFRHSPCHLLPEILLLQT